MTIYIESFIIQNCLINFCLLRLVELTTRPKSSVFRLIVASLVGSLFSVVVAVCFTKALWTNILKLSCAIFMLIISFKQSKKQFLFNFILLFIYTYALGGAVMGLSNAIYFTNAGIVMSSNLNLTAITLIIIVTTYIFELVVKHVNFKIKTNNLIYPTTLFLNNKKIKINAYLDTGNLLSYEGNPILVVDLETYLKLSGKSLINYYLTKSENLLTSTVNGKDRLKLFKLDCVQIMQGSVKKEFKDQYIAVTNNNFKNTNYQALLSPQFF